jgi:hypothetical protein
MAIIAFITASAATFIAQRMIIAGHCPYSFPFARAAVIRSFAVVRRSL